MFILGIDPAPTKPTVVCVGKPGAAPSFRTLKPDEVREGLCKLFSENRGPLLALWDAPLSLDPDGRSRFYARQIDSATKRWLHEGTTRVSAGAVGVSHAAQCPHNYLTQHVWGLPVGNEPVHGFRLLRPGFGRPTDADRFLAEVHPAVALAVWWQRSGTADKLQRYKPGPGVGSDTAKQRVAGLIDLLNDGLLGGGPTPREASAAHHAWDDDHLDAWIAWRLGCDLLDERASSVGPRGCASYVLPQCARWEEGRLHVDPASNG